MQIENIKMQIENITKDPQCYPQLDSTREIFQNDLTFAQRLRCHIEYVLEDSFDQAEDPNVIIIY